MKQIDRLLIEAKRIAGHNGKQLTLAMIERCGDSWTGSPDIARPLKPPHTPRWAPLWSISTLSRRSTPTAGMYPSLWMIFRGDVMAKKRLKMSTSREVRRAVNRIANMLLNGEIDAKTANAILYAANVTLGAIRTDEQQAKLDELERIVEEMRQ